MSMERSGVRMYAFTKENIMELRKLWDFPDDLFFPRLCPVCRLPVEAGGTYICPGCREQLTQIKPPYCLRCGKQLTAEKSYCTDCLRRYARLSPMHPGERAQGDFERNVAVFDYRSVCDMLMRLKYKNDRTLAAFFADEAAKKYGWMIQKRMQAECIVPVPIHFERRLKRGYNQTELIGRELSARLNIPMRTDLLCRRQKTIAQKKLNPTERLANLREVFCPGKAKGGIPDRLLLLDDVYTTGSTALACSRVLKEMGVGQVYVLTMAIGNGS